jgi:ABC-type lipoprotein export system ATPase subunit
MRTDPRPDGGKWRRKIDAVENSQRQLYPHRRRPADRPADAYSANTTEALNAGVAIIYQELHLIPEMTVAENIYLGQLPHKAGS